MTVSELTPGLILLAGAALLPLLRGRIRQAAALLLPVLAGVQAWLLIASETSVRATFLGVEIAPVHVHGATPAFVTIFCLMMLVGVIFALNQNRKVELPAAFVYGGGALGVLFAGDLITMFVFWEVMTLGSTVIIFSGGQRDSGGAGLRYFGVHAMGGVLLLMGIVMVIAGRIASGDPDPAAFRHMPEMIANWSTLSATTVGMWLVLIGMLVNVGAPPFSAWLADAYPEGSESGTAFLSAFTTKTAVFTLMVAFAGLHMLIWIGLYMTIYGIVYAILENDMRRLLAYSICTQVGFMLVGIGIGTELAIDGATAHAVSHILYKGLLMMSAGSVLFMTGKRNLNQLGGLYRTMPLTLVCAIIGAIAISSFPLTSGYVTKSLIKVAATDMADGLALNGQPYMHMVWVYFLLEGAAVGVFLHAGIKYPWFVFFGKDCGLRPSDPPWNMRIAMLVMAVPCMLLGFAPMMLYDILPYGTSGLDISKVLFGVDKAVVALSLLMFSALAFFLLLPLLKLSDTRTLDTDWLWRRFAPRFWKDAIAPLLEQIDSARRQLIEGLTPREGDRNLPRALRARLMGSWSVGIPVFVIVLMLLAYLLVYFWLLPGGLV